MKHILILIAFLSTGFCYGQKLNIKIKKDTVRVNIKGQVSSSLLIKDRYYCFFVEPVRTAYGFLKKFYILSLDGKVEQEIKVPLEVMKEFYYHMHFRNDSIIVTTDAEKNTLYLDLKKNAFIKIKDQDSFVYQDEKYYVTSSCSGEWGGTIYFRSKKDSKTYEASSTCPILVNRINDNYYVTNYMGHMMGFASILEIDDPLKMKVTYKGSMGVRESNSTLGVKNLLDTTELYIPASFVNNGHVYHFYSDDKSTKLAFLQNRKLVTAYDFKGKLYLSYQEQFSPDRQFLVFDTDKDNVFGFVDIVDDEMRIHYFINSAPNGFARGGKL